MATSTNGRRITTHEAIIKTASIEIKTLTLSGKQMTLAVFRQLEEDCLLDLNSEDFGYRGVPWGRVNYCSKDCTYYDYFSCVHKLGAHLHIVWQRDQYIYQSMMPQASYQCWYVRWSRESEDYNAYEALWKRRYAELEALDQLFIAV